MKIKKVSAKAIARAVKKFDAERCAQYMALVGWKWWDTQPNTPTPEQIRATIADLCKEVTRIGAEEWTCSTGGFHVTRYVNEDNEEVFSITFIPVSASTGE